MEKLNYAMLLEMQRKLDQAIKEAHNINLLEVRSERNIALITEFSEFANELSHFKYWKKNKNIDEEKVYEELADLLHFFFGYFNEVRHWTKIEDIEGGENILVSRMFLRFHEEASQITILDTSVDVEKLNESYSILLSIINHFKLDYKKIEEHYIRKNKINYERIKNNY